MPALEPVLEGYQREGKRYATIAVGCTGGKHRSVATAEELATRLAGLGVASRTVHRDLGAGVSGPTAARPGSSSLGGGHGLAASLSALRLLTDQLTAVVTVADDGGSSGRLRDELGVIPPGDLRMALSALCDDNEWGHTWRDLLQHRFASSGELHDHAVGNLLIVALWELLGDTVTGPGLGRPAARGARPGAADVRRAAGHRGQVVGLDPADPTRAGDRARPGRGRDDARAGSSAIRLLPGPAAGLPGGGGGDRGGRLGGPRARARGSPACCRTCWCPTWPRRCATTRPGGSSR